MRRVVPGPAPVALVLATALTGWVSLLAWGGFVVRSSDYLMPVLAGIAVIAGVGVVARHFQMPSVFVVSSQILGTLLFLNTLWGSSPVPTITSIQDTAQAFADSVYILQYYASPIPVGLENSMPILVLGGVLCYLLIDLLALSLGRVPLAGLPLLIVYTLPVSVLDRSVNWVVFVLTVIGFLVMLTLDEGSRVNRWGRDFGVAHSGLERSPFGPQNTRRHPVVMGVAATGLALLVPLAIPSLAWQPFDSGRGDGDNNNEVAITNPMTDLRRDLTRGADIPLLQVQTTGARPQYLRTSVLTTYTGDTWTPGDRNLPGSNTAEGAVPPPIGLSPGTQTTTQKWRIKVFDSLKSLWLPTPANIESIHAGDDWRYDADIMDFHAASDDTTTAGISYSLTELIPQMTGADLSRAASATPAIARRYSTIPSDLPESVSRAANQVTSGLATDFEQAQALQNWFRNEGEFTYSLEPSAGNGNNALEEFLTERIGYCEQFASAMSVMARTVGIPARVAVGFYQASKAGPDTWEFSSHDLHAWPELYFEDYGWVRFEPTPASHIGQTPTYTDDSIESPEVPRETAAATGDASPSALPSSSVPSEAPEPGQATDTGTSRGFDWTLVAWVIGGVLLLVLVLLAPRFLRRRRATRRWHDAQLMPAEAVWAELRDVCLDLGRPWPQGRSPRATGLAIIDWFGAAETDSTTRLPRTGSEMNPDAVRALERLVRALEEQRYSPNPSPGDLNALREDLALCVESLEHGVPSEARFRAAWAPRSLFRRGSVATGSEDKVSGPDGLDQSGDHVR